jgi:hypothetical protein
MEPLIDVKMKILFLFRIARLKGGRRGGHKMHFNSGREEKLAHQALRDDSSTN